MTKKLLGIYDKLYESFGPQNWWPADSDFEVAVGAILTQNTSWLNVERAIDNLRKARCLSFSKMLQMSEKKLAQLIRPAGYYNIKARSLKNFLRFLKQSYQGSLLRMRRKDTKALREELLCVNGIGPETADSILLYALHKPVFVVDAYTKRIASRHRLIKNDSSYHEIQHLFMRSLPVQVKLFNEYHALLVKCAKDFCKKAKGQCRECPIYEKN